MLGSSFKITDVSRTYPGKTVYEVADMSGNYIAHVEVTWSKADKAAGYLEQPVLGHPHRGYRVFGTNLPIVGDLDQSMLGVDLIAYLESLDSAWRISRGH